MTLSRRHLLAGLGALTLSGCAAPPGSRFSRAVRPRATQGVVEEPDQVGFNAVIDINHHDAVEDFALARELGGLRAVFHKASEGNDWVDPLYASRRHLAGQADLWWGAYHFGTRQHPGTEQARFFLRVAQPGPDTLLALDLELNEPAPGNSMTLAQAEDFVRTIETLTGRLPLLYVQPAWADGETVVRGGQSLKGAVQPGMALAACDLWLADYRQEPELPQAWAGRSWRFWQYAGDGGTVGQGPFGPFSRTMPGVDRCDRNLFNGDEAGLARYWSGASSS